MNAAGQRRSFPRALRRPPPLGRLRRPSGITESMRWLFTWLALASLVMVLPADLAARGPMLILAVAAAITLAGSWITAYLWRSAPLALDLVSAVAISAFALAGPRPSVVFPFLFPALWSRALYGSTRRAVLAAVFYAAATCAAVPLWTLNPAHSAIPDVTPLMPALGTAGLTLVAGRQLFGLLLTRERGVRRDTALASTGAQLLGMTDESKIRELGWVTASEICAATPGLRLILSRLDGSALSVRGTAGDFETVPSSLPGDIIGVDPRSGEAAVVDRRALDSSVGAELHWACLPYPPLRGRWLLVGAAGSIPPEALVAVRSLVNQLALAAANSRTHARLIAQASADALTGLTNRSSFTAAVTKVLASSDEAAPVHVLFLDLDDFKDVNDVSGHSAGDAVLVEVANRLRRCTRPEDVCARLGGDEFAVLLRYGVDRDAAAVARRIVDAVAEPIDLDRLTARVGATIGIATARPGSHIDAEQIVHEADMAMYAAKSEGKGRIRFFAADLVGIDSTRVPMVGQLATATARGEFVLHYQPILALPDLRCVAVEALVRWRHPERGLLSAADFIDTAERSGAIVDIGEFVLEQACAEAAHWPEVEPGIPLAVTINVSARQLGADRFVDSVRRSLARSGLPPTRLMLEIASIEALSSRAVVRRLTTLGGLGVGIILDNFGRGSSPWPVLRSVPVTAVKLDRDLVAGAMDNRVDRAVLRSIVALGAELGVGTIASGVERRALQEVISSIGADGVQGYLYSPPIAPAAIREWLADAPTGRRAMPAGWQSNSK